MVADGTRVSELVNLLRTPAVGPGVAMAIGELGVAQCSAVHVHPKLTQITYVLLGTLTASTRERNQQRPTEITVKQGECMVTPAGVQLQLANHTAGITKVLYVTSPGYLHLVDANGRVIFSDAIVLGADWEHTDPAAPSAAQIAEFEKLRDKALDEVQP